MKNFSSLKKISLILLIIVLLPALFYSGYEISSLSTSEEMFGRMYRQQLDAVLYSLNQYSWDAASSWAVGLQNIVSDRTSATRAGMIGSLRGFLQQRRTIHAVFLCDTALRTALVLESGRGSYPIGAFTEKNILLLMKQNRDKMDRLIDYQKVEYRKLEPVAFGDSSLHETPIILIFIANDDLGMSRVVGIVLEPRVFIQDILSRKIRDAAGDEFILAILNKRTGGIVETSSPVQAENIKQARPLWLFPDYTLGIRLRGKTIDELVQVRFLRSIAIIAGLDILLLAGAWLIYRTIRREMELIQLKSDFVSNVSHELRTPLSLIRMFAETLDMKRVKTEKKKREYYRTIIQESERLSHLVTNLLNFARMDAGKRNYNMREADVNGLVSKTMEYYTFQLKSNGFALAVDLAKDVPTIMIDEEAIAESLHNLIDNAIKYSNKEKYLRVATGASNAGAYVEVQDHGIGIAKEHQSKIFEKFYRVSTGLVHTTKGSGLGLALVRHIVDAHGGTIDVESSTGKGSVFRITLPIQHSLLKG